MGAGHVAVIIISSHLALEGYNNNNKHYTQLCIMQIHPSSSSQGALSRQPQAEAGPTTDNKDSRGDVDLDLATCQEEHQQLARTDPEVDLYTGTRETGNPST